MAIEKTDEHYQLFRNKFTYLSFFLSIFVILIHTNNLDVYHIDSGFLFYFESIINSFANYAVPTFFMLSGYQFYRNLKPTEIKRKLKSRFFSIVIPFIIWGVIEFLYFGLLKSVPMIGAQMNASGKPFALSSLMGILVYGESHLWFLRNLILYHLVSLFFYRLLKNKYLFPVVVVCFVILPLAIPSLDAARGIIKNFPFYIIGAGLSCHFGEWFESDFKKKVCGILWNYCDTTFNYSCIC